MTNNIKIWKEDFAIIKSKNHNINSFANIHDGKEITLVIEKSKINKKEMNCDQAARLCRGLRKTNENAFVRRIRKYKSSRKCYK